MRGCRDAPVCGDGSLGPVSMFAMDTLTVVRAARVIVGRDAGGLFAVSAVCTHQGYDLSVQNQQIVCLNEPVESHGTVFDRDGRVLTGPAPSALANLRVSVCDGRVFVGSERVPAGTRTAVG